MTTNEVKIASSPEEADADHDAVFYDVGGPGEEDGFMWAFAPDDSAFVERFDTQDKAVAYAADWISRRNA